MTMRSEHPEEDLLLRRLDGELDGATARRIDLHIATCRQCSERSESISYALAQATAAVHQQHVRTTGDPPSGFREFERRLSDLEEKFRRVAVPATGKGTRYIYSAAVVMAAAACILLVIVLYPARHLPAVAAKDVLDRAATHRRSERSAFIRPVVRQKVRIRLGAQEFTRTIYRDVVNRKDADVWDEARPGHKRKAPRASEVVQRRFSALALDWNDPLSPEVFTAWHHAHADVQRDRVTEIGPETIITAAGSGPIRSATLRLRTADYHPTSESLALTDDQQLEITELEYRVAAFSPVDETVFRPPPSSARGVDAAVVRPPAPVDAEINARHVLHSLGADLDEEIEVKPGADGTVEVTGLVTTADRKSEMERALSAIPGVAAHLRTIDEAMLREPPRAAAARSGASIAAAQSRSEILSERIPDPLEREAFLARAFDSSQKLLSRAFALKRLSERYPPDQEGQLSEVAKNTLHEMVRDHLNAMQQNTAALQQQLASAFTSHLSGAAVDADRESWQAAAAGLSGLAQKVDLDLTTLFARTTASNDPKLLQGPGALSVDLARVEAVLRRIQKAFGPGTSPP